MSNKKLSRLLEPNLKFYFFFMLLFVAAAVPVNWQLALAEAAVTALLYVYFRQNNQKRRQSVLQYIDSVTGLHAGASAVSGDFSLQSAGFLIKDGKKTDEYVKSFTVAGNFYDLLKNITALGNKVVLPTALGSTAFASPAVLVEGLSIAGK